MNTNTNFKSKVRNDYLLNYAIQKGREAGFSEEKTLRMFIDWLLDLKDECFQEKLEAAMNQPAPNIFKINK